MVLDAYLDRVGLAQPAAPTRAALDALIAAHQAAIPFSNLEILRGEAVSLAPEAVAQKLIRDRRGGYCFEQNGLFQRVLQRLGFAVTPVGARVTMGRPPGEMTRMTHLVLAVTLDGESWLADVGFGGLTPTAALRIEAGRTQKTPHGVYRLAADGAGYHLQTRLGDTWADLYRVSMTEMHPVDQEVANWWTSTHPEGGFRHRLAAARALPGGTRLTLSETEFKRRHRDGAEAAEPIQSRAQLLRLLEREFALSYPPGTRFRLPGVGWAAA